MTKISKNIIKIEFQRNVLRISAKIHINRKKLGMIILLIAGVVLLIVSSMKEELRKTIPEILLRIFHLIFVSGGDQLNFLLKSA